MAPLQGNLIGGTVNQTDVENMPMPVLNDIDVCPAPMTFSRSNPSENDMKDSGTWYVAAASCQPFFWENEQEQFAVGESGTTIQPGPVAGPVSMLVRMGRIMVASGEQTTTMVAGKTRITVPPKSAAIIEQRTSGVTRVTSLNGGGVMVAVAYTESGPVHLKPGEDVAVFEEGTNDEELIPVDGVARDLIVSAKLVAMDKASNPPRRLRMTHSRYDQVRLAQEDALLNCGEGCFAAKMKFRLKRIKEDMRLAGQAQPKFIGSEPARFPVRTRRFDGRPVVKMPPVPTMPTQVSGMPQIKLNNSGWTTGVPMTPAKTPTDDPSQPSQPVSLFPNMYKEREDDTPFSPVAFGQRSASTGSAPRYTDHESASICTVGSSRYQTVADGTYVLTAGEILVNSHRNVTIKAPNATIVAKPGAAVLVSTNGDVTTIRNLYEPGASTVKVSSSSHFAHVPVGSEIVIGPSKAKVLEFLKTDLVGRRRIQVGDVKSGGFVSSEVSLISLLNQSDLMRAVGRSQHVQSKSMVNKLLKMAACISVVTAAHGGYNEHRDR